VTAITRSAPPVRVITASIKGLGQFGTVGDSTIIRCSKDSTTEEGNMYTKLAAALAVLALLGGCQPRDRDTGALDRDRSGTDTSIRSSSIKDTTVVKADTSIDVDRVKKTDNIKKDR